AGGCFVAELIPAAFGTLVHRAFVEFERQRRIFDLPERKFYRARPGLDLAVRFHGQPASNAVGPAAGPQTQMVQNIVLSWLAGGRIFELKTVQINDRPQIPRPCIDATNVGYNVEWSQELRLERSLREYVGAHMLLEMLRASAVLDGAYEDESFARSDWIFDFSVGYDLKGIRHPRVVEFMRSCMHADGIIAELRPQIPARYTGLRDLPFERDIVRSATLSTFHGCPADEIEDICEFILRQMGLHVTIKLNPTLLGVERCEQLLHDEMGYQEIRVAPEHFDADLKFDEMVPMVQRLQKTAAQRGLGLGVKLTNTLVIRNHKTFFSDDVMYLSGAPLHVLTMNILRDVRNALGPEFPISFSAGIDAHNFARAMSCNLTPITTCTDLLRPGGYGRLPLYLVNLENEMERLGVRTVGDFILRVEHRGEDAARQAIAELKTALQRSAATSAMDPVQRESILAGADDFVRRLEHRACEAIRGSPFQDVRAALGAVWKTRPDSLHSVLRSGRERSDLEQLYRRMVALAGMLNIEPVVERTTHDPRYAAGRNSRVPRKIGSQLMLYDCINCDKCVPVCPNDANFVYHAKPQEFTYVNYRWEDGTFVEEPGARFVVVKEHQIANYADFCNECGNCDVFCPEDGGPFVEKPRFFSSLESWSHDDGVAFYVRPGRQNTIWGRFEDGAEHLLQVDPETGHAVFKSAGMEVDVDTTTHRPSGARFPKGEVEAGTRLDMRAYHVLRTLLDGVLSPDFVNYINTRRF
ncbi:MAG: 4Fe-4S dicluster domain-containing protein, partial [Candidatus Krumholzibacteriia bacterium]